MNPKEAERQVREEERKEQAEKIKREFWPMVNKTIAEKLNMVRDHKIEYESDGRCYLSFCRVCNTQPQQDMPPKCIPDFAGSPDCAWELVNRLNMAGWIVSFSVDKSEKEWRDVVAIAKPKNPDLVGFSVTAATFPQAVCLLALKYANEHMPKEASK